MSTFGVDYAWGRPGPAALKKAGVKFVCRYLSHDTKGKNLTKAEADLLSDNGIWLVVVWETTAQRALAGHSAGEADARFADAQARACGMPAGRPIYFAVDWDASSGQQGAIDAYLDGAASVIGRGRVGLYAGYGPIKRAFDAHKIAYGWQTYAWSGGHWDTRAQIQQYSNDHLINGVGCDYDRAMTSDYGQWRVGVSPKEDDMPLNADDKKWLTETLVPAVVKANWNTDAAKAPAGAPGTDTNPTWAYVNVGRETYTLAAKILTLVTSMALKTPDVDEAALAAAILAVLTPQAIADALPADIAADVVDELTKRLET